MPLPSPRARLIEARYDDPLDLVWLSAARRCGIARVERSDHVFAAWDGAGTLTLATSACFDADDSLAQLLFHELCHALLEGEAAAQREDWGLSNTDERDLWREQACLRLQATLAETRGLRGVLAPTTDHRAYYDALPADPLATGDDPAIAAAQQGWQRARDEPWAEALATALDKTRQIALLVGKEAPVDSIFRRLTAPVTRPGFPPCAGD